MFLPLVLVLSLFGFAGSAYAKLSEPLVKKPLLWTFGDSELQLSSRIRMEGFYGKNVEFLNNVNDDTDQSIIPARFTCDLTLDYGLGREKFGFNILTTRAVIRSKGIFGDPESIAASDKMSVKLDANVFGEHSHALNRHYLWFRELWVESSINELFGFNFANTHTFTVGLFPFELGRGISLGVVYASDPDVLGFYSPNAVDQYAPGFKLSGSLDNNNKVRYDAYVELMTNRADSFRNVNLEIRGQEYGRLCTPWRGFGKINWLTAGRLMVDVYKTPTSCITVEPYALYLDQREQRIEFLGDASTKLGTLGFAVEANMGTWEFGCEFAQNIGRQAVAGWDRNTIEMKSVGNDGFVQQYNTHVVLESNASTNAPYTKANQVFVNNAIRDAAQNDQPIGGGLKNKIDRFRNPYTNTLSGYMVVADALWVCDPKCKFAATVGVASGDEAPNKDLDELGDSRIDGNYRGFVSLQEQYTGKRVNSAFLMSGSGKIPRILSFPNPDLVEGDVYPDRIAQFNNLVFVGSAAYIKAGSWTLNPNVLSYWQENASRVFDAAQGKVVSRYANPWLGIEFNLYTNVILDNSIKLYSVSSVFIPGTHYSDIKGRPLNKAQQKYLDQANDTGALVKRVPLLGTDPAFTMNVGMEYRF